MQQPANPPIAAAPTPEPAPPAAEPVPPPEPALRCGAFDRFGMYYGNPLSGIDLLELDGAGHAHFFFVVRTRTALTQRDVEFDLDPAALAALRDKLDELGFCALEPRYTANLHDGLQQSYSVWHGETRHRVYCDNLFPPPIVALRQLLETSILPARAGLERSSRVTPRAELIAAIARVE